uniref:CSON000776 protein n=1 Tax=Culicoides sonorensis TaxID=179676 RepID=A0A336MJK6_CULSO
MGNLSNAKQDSNVPGASNTNNSTSTNNTTNNSNNKESGGFGQKFTTSNFTQSVVMKSDSVFGNGGNESNKGPPNSSSNNSANSNQSNINNTGSNNMSGTTSGSKKRKSDGRITSGTNIDESNKDIIKDLSVTLVPLQGYDKIEVADAEKSIKKFCISQPKSEAGAIVTTSAGTPTEPTLQNLSPNIVSSKQQQNLLNVQSTNSGTNNHSGKQLKEQQQNQVTVSGVPPNSTPSLVVSVPLSTANVPGVNLSSNTSNNNSNNNNNLSVPSIQQQQQGTAGNTYQAHRNESGNIHNSTLDRHSPLIQHRTSSPAVHSISPIDHGVVHSGSSGGPNTNMMDTQNPSTMLKFTYEKHPNSRLTTLQEDTSPTVRRSRTPEVMYSSSSSSGFSGLKFGYESQTPSTVPSSQPSVVVTQPPTIKDSPPSSPGSEVGTKKPSKKQKTASSSSNTTVSAISPVETKENKLFHNGVHAAAHMLGNQLNPNSSMAPKLTESLNMEIEAHIANATPLNDQNNLVGPTYPGKLQANRSSVLTSQGTTSSMSLSSMLAGSTSASGNTPQSLEQLLERQWEQGSQFLMEQAQHFDIASLLSCLHQLKSENIRIEEHVTNLVARRDHLLAVNARLAIPLNPNTSTNQGHFNNMHPAVNGPTTVNTEPTVVSITSSNSNSQGNVVSSGGSGRQRISNSQSQQQPQQLPSQMQQQYSGGALPLENGIDFRQQAQTQQIVRHSSGSQSYSTSSSRSSSIGRGSSSASYTSQQTIYNTHQATIRRDDVKPS